MGKTNKSLIAAGVIAAALGASAGVYAQAQAPGAPPPAQGQRQMGQRGQMDPAQMQQRMAERQAERAQRVHDLLQITPNQENAFKAWQDAMKPPAIPSQADRQARRDAIDKMTTPQRFDDRLAQSTERFNAQKTRIEATKRFYNVLSASQKKAFDAMAEGGRDRMGRVADRMRDGRGGGMMRGGQGMRGPGGPMGGTQPT